MTEVAVSSSAVTPAGGPTSPSSQEDAQRIVNQYKGMRAQISELANKISELDSDRNEHALVVRAITGLDGNRRCYRSIGGVLVERTVKEVLPAVENNLKQITDLITQLSDQLKEKEKECDEFREKFNIRMQGEELFDAPEKKSGDRDSDKSSSSGGVLA